ncbi:MAG: DUF177 domain-containing protein [Rhodospirillaceae bacterium]|nr:DUF177 domain-containing protein [Rhodospirillaceae bacterium]
MTETMSETMSETREFSRLFDCERLGTVDFTMQTEANMDERAALAKRFDLLDLSELTVDAVISPSKKGQIRLSGSFKAQLTQACVVTLKPVESQIEATFERIFSEKTEAWYGSESEPDEDGAGMQKEPPEPLIEGCLDVGEVVAEQLSLEMNPFPRVAGAEFEGSKNDDDDDDGPESPFAVLETLNK